MAIHIRMTVPAARETSWNARGRDLVAVSNVMEARGCWGRYDPHLRYGHPVEEGGYVIEVQVTCAPTIQLPSWAPYAGSTPEVQAEWDRMMAALRRHEAEHHRIFQREAQRFRRRMRRLRGRQTHDDWLEQWGTFNDDADDAQAVYDARTRNGANDGVSLGGPGFNDPRGS